MAVNWHCKFFKDLSPQELYNILRLRSEVFVVEQNCVFLDMDNYDQLCYHLFAEQNNQVVATSRVVPPGLIYQQASIGRVVTAPSVRNTGVGKALMHHSIEKLFQLFGQTPIKIGAQLYLRNFYESLGFEKISDVYQEDGIEHIYMLKNP